MIRTVLADDMGHQIMIEIDRRRALGLGAVLPFASALPAAFATTASAADSSAAAWDLTEIYPDVAAWDAARKQVLDALPRLAAYKGTLGQSADALTKALDDIYSVSKEVARVYVYSSLKADEDARIAENQERKAQAQDMYTAFGQATAWQSPEILKIGREKIESFIAASDTLKRHFAFPLRDTLRQAEHTLDTQGEQILASAASPLTGPASIRNQLVTSDMPRPMVTLSDGREIRLDDQGYTLSRDAPNRDDRKKVFDAFWGSYNEFENTFGAALAAKIKGDIFESEARKYPNALSMALSANNIPEGVYRTLVSETNAGLPQLHRYFQLRQRMLKLPDIHYYDIYPPLVSMERKFTLPDMRNIAMEALKPLGPDYVKQLGIATAAKWMDPFPRPGKRSGAYMNGSIYDLHPYLLLNLGENFEGLSTYVHEWGHAIHTLLTNKAQPYALSDYPIFTAEIASTCNELLLNEYMLSRAKTKQERIYYLGMRLESVRGTYFRQTMFAEFELKVHEMAEAGEGLSGASISRAYLDLLKRYHGPDFIIDAPYAIEWAYIGHFFYFFYVYQYATSITAGTWFANSILKGGKAERENYLNVLRAGGSDYPTEILQRAGLDMASPEPYRGIIAGFGETLDEIESLLR